MTREFRILFVDPRGVTVEADTEEEAIQIVKERDWEHGMDWNDGDIEIISTEEMWEEIRS